MISRRALPRTLSLVLFGFLPNFGYGQTASVIGQVSGKVTVQVGATLAAGKRASDIADDG